MLRTAAIVAFLLLTIVGPFVLFGDQLETLLSQDAIRRELEANAGIAWLVAIGLLAVDILLPVPSSVVIGALGIVYGVALGGLIASLGLVAAGLLGYGLCRLLGRALALRFAGDDALQTSDALFARHGGWLVALSRPVPVLAEVAAMSAGLAAMPFRAFVVAVACGAVPVAYLFATIGFLGAEQPVWAAGACLAVAGLFWATATYALKYFAPARASDRSITP